MGLNFRGEANRLGKRNQHGFQEKSAPGPRQGQGGDQPGSLARAEKRFGNITSPAKIKKNFYGGEAYFQDGYGGDLGSPAKKSCSPITARAKNSPLKMNQALVDGAANTNKQFVDAGAIVAGALNQPDKKAKGKTADLAPKAKTPRKKQEGVDLKAVDIKSTNPLDNMEAPTLEF